MGKVLGVATFHGGLGGSEDLFCNGLGKVLQRAKAHETRCIRGVYGVWFNHLTSLEKTGTPFAYMNQPPPGTGSVIRHTTPNIIN